MHGHRSRARLDRIARRRAGAAPAAGSAPPPPPMTNLQIIPKDTPRPQVLATMQAFTAVARRRSATTATCMEGRGGRNDMASDEKPTKKAARGMMLLAREINTKLPEAVGKAADATTRVGCATCHRGVPIPKQIADIVTDAAATRRRDGGARQVQGAADAVLRRPELRLQRGRPDRDRAARQHREQGRRCAGLPEREPRVLPEVGAHLRRRSAQVKNAKATRPARSRRWKSGRARPEQRSGEGAARRSEEVADN